uniref:Actin-rearrangement-inducing factor n=1 Tax=Helicoverpa armigera nucleopolyhedrovirus TaxID=51313 RepID=A0A0E3JAC0_9ABAC|nr:actin-rearrangement-inducing factor [Helicoverpa armigera nucleopolyhedrovirus]AJP07827.1 actin-rearrangement-inducing factor [Helicoverpa armigera nucleopolyhedrovirus]
MCNMFYLQLIFFSVLGIGCTLFGMYGIFDTDWAVQLDYGLVSVAPYNCSNLLCAYGFMLCLACIFSVITSKVNSTWPLVFAFYFTLLCAIIVMCLLTMLEMFVQHGHIGALDVHYRNYDIDKTCWKGIVEYKQVDSNSIVVDMPLNCYEIKYQIFCASCRNVYKPYEATFFKNHRITVYIALGTIFTWHCLCLIQLLNKYVRHKSFVNHKNNDTNDHVESMYCVPKHPARPISFCKTIPSDECNYAQLKPVVSIPTAPPLPPPSI